MPPKQLVIKEMHQCSNRRVGVGIHEIIVHFMTVKMISMHTATPSAETVGYLQWAGGPGLDSETWDSKDLNLPSFASAI